MNENLIYFASPHIHPPNLPADRGQCLSARAVRNAEDELSEREEEREAERLPGVLVIETGGQRLGAVRIKLGTPDYHQRFVFKTKAKRFTGKFRVIIIFHGGTKKNSFFLFFLEGNTND